MHLIITFPFRAIVFFIVLLVGSGTFNIANGQSQYSRTFHRDWTSFAFENGNELTVQRNYLAWKKHANPDILNSRVVNLGAHRPMACFRDPNNKTSVLILSIVSSSNHGIALHRVDTANRKLELLIQMPQRLRQSELSFQQLENGNILMISNQGALFQFRDQKTVDQYIIDGFYQEPSKMFSPIMGTVNGNDAYFFSNVEADFAGKALRHLVRLHDGQFEKVDLDMTQLTSQVFFSESSLKFISNNEFVSYDFETQEIEKATAKFPVVDDIELIPIQFVVPQNGKPLAIFRKPHLKEYKSIIEMFPDGYYTQIAELDGDQWRLVNIGLDDVISSWSGKYEFSHDPNGRFWIASMRSLRLVVREPDGQFLAIDPSELFDSPDIHNAKFSGGNVIFYDRFARLKSTLPKSEVLKFSQGEPAFENWQRLRLLTPLISDRQGALYAVSKQNGGTLLQIKAGEINYFEPPPREEFRIAGPIYLSTDTDGNVWLFSAPQERVAVYESGQWQVFAGEKQVDDAKNARRAKQVAFQDRAEKLKDPTSYRIGLTGPFQVRFGTDKQVVYFNRNKRVAYFDGAKWHAPTFGTELTRNSRLLNPTPFIYKSLIGIQNSNGKTYGVPRSKLIAMESVDGQRPWRSLNLNSKLIEKIFGEAKAEWKPSSLGEPFQKPYASGMSWLAKRASNRFSEIAAEKKLAIALRDQPWSVISTEDTPLDFMSKPMFTAVQEDLFIFRSNSYRKRLMRNTRHDQWVWKSPRRDNLSLASDVSFVVQNKGDSIQPKFDSSVPSEEILYRWKIEDDQWSKWTLGNSPATIRPLAKPGDYVAQLQVCFANELAVTQNLELPFQTNYSLEEAISEAIAELANEKATWQTPYAKLLRVGPAAIPAINEAKVNAETKMTRERLEQLINEIREKYVASPQPRSLQKK